MVEQVLVGHSISRRKKA